MSPSSNIIPAFYLGQAQDSSGRTIEQIWSYDDYRLENIHDYIQWLFPLKERSKFNSSAPVLDDQAIREFRGNQELQKRLLISFQLMLKFYGFQLQENQEQIRIDKSSDYPEKKRNWITPGNHNFLRITRILTSLNLLGLEPLSHAFLDCLEQIYTEEKDVIGATTIRYWRDTANKR